MRTPIAAGLLLSVLVVNGCHKAVEINPSAQPVGNRWNATLATPAGLSGAIQVTGTGWMAPGSVRHRSGNRGAARHVHAAQGGR